MALTIDIEVKLPIRNDTNTTTPTTPIEVVENKAPSFSEDITDRVYPVRTFW